MIKTENAEQTKDDLIQELAESYVNGNISHVRETIHKQDKVNAVALALRVVERLRGQFSGDDPAIWRRFMYAMVKDTSFE